MVKILLPCEMIVKKILPALRAYIVRRLYEKYKMKQGDIAKSLDITQPSVSLYLTGDRGGFEDIFKIEAVIDNIHILDELSEKLVNKDLSEHKLIEYLCNFCFKLRKAQAFCKIHSELDKNRHAACNLCEMDFVEEKKVARYW